MPRLVAKRLAAVLAGCCLLCSCGTPPRQQQYTATFLGLFDTVTTVMGCAESEEAFRALAQTAYDELLIYHRLFDIYHDYEGLTNLKTVNDQAGMEAVAVDGPIIALLKDCREYYALTGGRVNVAMGKVLSLWKTEDSPSEDALTAAAQHMDMASLVIDESASTVYLADPAMQLDVGAVAKGWAAQRVAEILPSGLLLSVGGNVCATGPRDESGSPWRVGVRDPAGTEADYLCTLAVTGGCVVTSGSYQRGEHIIDPDTLRPAGHWSAVTVVCADSGLADALSTALFLLPLKEGMALAEACGAAALWVTPDGTQQENAAFSRLKIQEVNP